MAEDMLEILDTSMLVPRDSLWVVGKSTTVKYFIGVSAQYSAGGIADGNPYNHPI